MKHNPRNDGPNIKSSVWGIALQTGIHTNLMSKSRSPGQFLDDLSTFGREIRYIIVSPHATFTAAGIMIIL